MKFICSDNVVVSIPYYLTRHFLTIKDMLVDIGTNYSVIINTQSVGTAGLVTCSYCKQENECFISNALRVCTQCLQTSDLILKISETEFECDNEPVSNLIIPTSAVDSKQMGVIGDFMKLCKNETIYTSTQPYGEELKDGAIPREKEITEDQAQFLANFSMDELADLLNCANFLKIVILVHCCAKTMAQRIETASSVANLSKEEFDAIVEELKSSGRPTMLHLKNDEKTRRIEVATELLRKFLKVEQNLNQEEYVKVYKDNEWTQD